LAPEDVGGTDTSCINLVGEDFWRAVCRIRRRRRALEFDQHTRCRISERSPGGEATALLRRPGFLPWLFAPPSRGLLLRPAPARCKPPSLREDVMLRQSRRLFPPCRLRSCHHSAGAWPASVSDGGQSLLLRRMQRLSGASTVRFRQFRPGADFVQARQLKQW